MSQITHNVPLEYVLGTLVWNIANHISLSVSNVLLRNTTTTYNTHFQYVRTYLQFVKFRFSEFSSYFRGFALKIAKNFRVFR